MASWAEGRRPITIAILAMGGEGGGVLSNWVVAMAESAGHVAQSTSVAGVAQRTGATIYYVEIYPPTDHSAHGARPAPILSMMPTPGEVDIVVASELMEAGRSVQRGFVTPNRTTLIASTNRVYSIDERSALGDGRVDSEELLAGAQRASRRFIGADFMAIAEGAGSVISASLFGALAGSEALPFTREQYEAAVSGTNKAKAVEASLNAFARGYEVAQQLARADSVIDSATEAVAGGGPAAPRVGTPVPVQIGLRRPVDPAEEAAAQEARQVIEAATRPGEFVGPRLQDQAARVGRDFPPPARLMLLRGCARTALYQDVDYANRYLDRVARLAAFEPDPGDTLLTTEAARHVALWMCYQDTIHVALQKVRLARLERVRVEAHAESDQLIQVREYLHPQIDELTDMMPTAMGTWLARSRLFQQLVHAITRKGMVVNTTSLAGYTTLSTLARLRPLRPRSLRFGREQVLIDAWLDLAVGQANLDYQLALEIIMCQRVLKGYGQTHEHGSDSFATLLRAARELAGRDDAALQLAKLRSAALADEDGARLRAGLAGLQLA